MPGLGLVAAALLSGYPAYAQTPTPAPPTTPPAPAPAKEADKPKPKPGEPKPYADVVPATAINQDGMFKVHQVDDKVLYEIPPSLLDRDLMWYTEIAKHPSGYGYPGEEISSRVVRFTRHKNKIYLVNVNFDRRATGTGPINDIVRDATVSSIIAAFDVEAEGKDKAPVIDVTRLYNTDVPEFSVKSAISGGGIDAGRSYLDSVKDFPENIEVRSMLTFTRGGTGPDGASSVTVLVHHSLNILPDKPMQGRFFDSRVGYFTEGFEDYGRPENENGVVNREFIVRYRLEKKDPTAPVSEPVKPIVYYMSREIPEEWRPYIKQGVEDWNEAFEQAGFKNAIICKLAPSEKEDPRWDPEDARYSVIRWAPEPVENAMGPNLHDPRSGEVISAHIIVWHNILKLNEEWYFSQVGDLDPRCARLPLPQSLEGDMLRFVITHEVGHTLGLRHNHKASSSFTCAQLRDPAFTAKNGDEASIMDYGRFNYVAQPGDNARLIPKLGPYDRFAIEWGYKPMPGTPDPVSEKPLLDTIAARQVSDATLRFGGEDMNSITDPTVETEDLGSDPVEASTYGLKNIRRVAKMLISATTKFGEDYTRLQEMYNAVREQRLEEIFHVVKLVGGVVQTDYHAGRGSVVYVPVPAAKQAEAVSFLIANEFQPATELLDPAVLYRLQPTGVTDRATAEQSFFLNNLLSDMRIRRLQENEALNGARAYTVTQLVAQVQNGVWTELTAVHPTISLYRRSLQRTYLTTMKTRLLPPNATTTDLRPVGLAALERLSVSLHAAEKRTLDPLTLAHLKDCDNEVERILHPKI
jgi:hypothetical protein